MNKTADFLRHLFLNVADVYCQLRIAPQGNRSMNSLPRHERYCLHWSVAMQAPSCMEGLTSGKMLGFNWFVKITRWKWYCSLVHLIHHHQKSVTLFLHLPYYRLLWSSARVRNELLTNHRRDIKTQGEGRWTRQGWIIPCFMWSDIFSLSHYKIKGW